MPLETTLGEKEEPTHTERTLSKLTGMGKTYFEISERVEKDQRDSFSKLYQLMQRGDTMIGLRTQNQLIEEIRESPLEYNFDFIVNALEFPILLSRKVPTIYKHDSRIEASQKLIGEYFGEKLASKITAREFANISYN